MSFFEPLPPPPPPSARKWAPPLWDRPSEGTIPTLLPVGEIIQRRDDVVVALEHLRVYPNGFTINISILTNPHFDPVRPGSLMMGRGGVDLFQRFPRIGVRFADGRTAGRDASHPLSPTTNKDEQGIPTDPVVTMSGGGGGSHGYHFGVWVFPLPPDGPLEIFVSLPAAGGESKVTLDGAAVRAAAATATVIWT